MSVTERGPAGKGQAATAASSGAPATHRYDRAEHDLVGLVAAALGASALETLGHREPQPLLTRGTDQATPFHRRFYESFSSLADAYERFVREVAGPIIGEAFCYQTIPTFRIHLPANVGVGTIHTDADYNHPAGEVNFWVPLTRAWDTNTLWIERARGGGDLAPLPPVGPGQVVVFDAVGWRHGTMRNSTGSTRVSFDFRCIPLSRYQPTDARSENTNQRLVIGDYFRL